MSGQGKKNTEDNGCSQCDSRNTPEHIERVIVNKTLSQKNQKKKNRIRPGLAEHRCAAIFILISEIIISLSRSLIIFIYIMVLRVPPQLFFNGRKAIFLLRFYFNHLILKVLYTIEGIFKGLKCNIKAVQQVTPARDLFLCG
ncbi:hypothetical protein HK26_06010 [Acetobacter okinawensis]|uniref:Uncharacterized protein n=1 Tax=Acetobacter okinawensis TaxID=1076594 RepID=A0A252BSK4_9PROT|nr:hypothetical protein HK26_06010 [Acetobacter okinawensis]